MSLASGRRCMRPGETRSRRCCRSKARRRRHRRLRGLRPQPLPRSAHLSLWRNLQSQRPIRRLRQGRRLRSPPRCRRPRPPRPLRARKPRRSPRSRHRLRLPPLLRLSPLRRRQKLRQPGLGEAAKIELRLGELEAAIKERSNATVTRADVDKAETQTSDQISRLAAIVTRLTGQVKDLEDQVRTESAGAQEKLADLTRRVSLSELKSAVAAAERANVSQAAEASAATQAPGSRGRRRACA